MGFSALGEGCQNTIPNRTQGICSALTVKLDFSLHLQIKISTKARLCQEKICYKSLQHIQAQVWWTHLIFLTQHKEDALSMILGMKLAS